MVKLKNLISPPAWRLTSIYKYPRDGDINEFHRRADGVGSTLIIIKSEFDQIFGGFTTIPWSTQGGKKVGNGTTFIFKVLDDGKVEKF